MAAALPASLPFEAEGILPDFRSLVLAATPLRGTDFFEATDLFWRALTAVRLAEEPLAFAGVFAGVFAANLRASPLTAPFDEADFPVVFGVPVFLAVVAVLFCGLRDAAFGETDAPAERLFLAAGFLATVFLAAGFLTAGFLATGFFLPDFLTAGFPAALEALAATFVFTVFPRGGLFLAAGFLAAAAFPVFARPVETFFEAAVLGLDCLDLDNIS